MLLVENRVICWRSTLYVQVSRAALTYSRSFRCAAGPLCARLPAFENGRSAAQMQTFSTECLLICGRKAAKAKGAKNGTRDRRVAALATDIRLAWARHEKSGAGHQKPVRRARLGRGQHRDRSRAIMAACVRLRAPSFRQISLTCSFMVGSRRPSCRAISLLA